MYKFPYGIADFKQIKPQGYYYADRTNYIPELEEAGKTLVFVRPRRFGKSLLISMLETYYDIAEEQHFAHYFGELAISQAPTECRARYRA